MENILIVGSQGYIGTVLCAELIKKKINIIGVDNFIYSQKKINFNSKKYSFLKCDLRNTNKIVKIANTASQVVVLAGLVGDPITKKYKKLS
jgi:UDP-glucose 4-epimerase